MTFGLALLVLALMGAAGAIGHGLGIRQERGRWARWNELQELSKTAVQARGGARLRRVRVTRQ